MKSRLFLLAVFLVVACDTYPGRSRRADGAADGSALRPATLYELEARARTLLFAWRDAQNDGDIQRLALLYDPACPALAGRKALAGAKTTIAVEGASFNKVHDTMVATFTERRRSTSHAEHGTRSVVIDPRGLIVREEPMLPRPGWAEEEPTLTDGSPLASPIIAQLEWIGGRLVFKLTGANDKKIELVLHYDPARAGIRIGASDGGGQLFTTTFGSFDTYRITRESDAIVVCRGVEESGIAQVEAARVDLGPGARVLAR